MIHRNTRTNQQKNKATIEPTQKKLKKAYKTVYTQKSPHEGNHKYSNTNKNKKKTQNTPQQAATANLPPPKKTRFVYYYCTRGSYSGISIFNHVFVGDKGEMPLTLHIYVYIYILDILYLT